MNKELFDIARLEKEIDRLNTLVESLVELVSVSYENAYLEQECAEDPITVGWDWYFKAEQVLAQAGMDMDARIAEIRANNNLDADDDEE